MKKKIQERPKRFFFFSKTRSMKILVNLKKFPSVLIRFEFHILTFYQTSIKNWKKTFFQAWAQFGNYGAAVDCETERPGFESSKVTFTFFPGFIFFRELFSFCVLNQNSTQNWTKFRKEPRFLAVNYLNKIVYLTFLIIFIFPNILLKIGFIVLFRGKVSDPSPRGRVFIVQ